MSGQQARALGALGINSFKAKDYQQAEQYLKQAVELHSRLGSSNLGECSHYLARTYERLKQTDEARRVIMEALQGHLREEEIEKLKGLLTWLGRRK